MKKSTLLLWAVALISFNGCGGIKGLMIYETDPTLKTITQVRPFATMNSVGFEWDKIESHRTHGINIYRGLPSEGEQSLKQIGSIGNRYATHFVDTHVKPDTSYMYTFTTFSLGQESRHSSVLEVKTLPAFPAVSFVQAYKVAPNAVKLLWKPHDNPSVDTYIVQRSVNGGEWKFVAQVKGQLMVEYIDTFVRSGHNYEYRIIAQSYDKIQAKPSQTTQLTL